MSATVVIVDATNVARAATPPIDEARLEVLITRWALQRHHDVIIVFDGAGPAGVHGDVERGPHVRVIGAGEADPVIISEAAACAAAGRPHVVVTDDRALAQLAGANAVTIVSTASLLADLVADAAEHDDTTGHGAGAPPDRAPDGLGTRLDAVTRARLDALRYGDGPPSTGD